MIVAVPAPAGHVDAAATVAASAVEAPLPTTVRVRFRGPMHGVVVLRASAPFAAAAAGNMLGAMDDPDPGIVRDAVGEIANVLCGNLLPMLAGSAAVFTLDAPEPQRRATDPVVDAHDALAARCTLLADEGEASVALYWSDPFAEVAHLPGAEHAA